jgi:hypothetical protein
MGIYWVCNCGGAMMLKEEYAVMENTEPKKYKYILNGETLYFTREELIEREREINIKNDINLSVNALEKTINQLIKKLEEYNGDPFGDYLGCPELHKRFHKASAKGIRIVYR